jgi:hypothetical protein
MQPVSTTRRVSKDGQPTFGDEAASTVDTSWVELDKLEILKGQAGTNYHRITITRTSMRTCAAEIRASISTSSQNSLVCTEAMKSTVLEVESDDAYTFSLVHDQVESKVLDEEVGVVS